MEKLGKIVSILIVSALLLSLFTPLAQAAEQPTPGATEREGPVGLELSVSEFDPQGPAELQVSISDLDQQGSVEPAISTQAAVTLTLTPSSQQVTVGMTATLTATVLITGGLPVTDGTWVGFVTQGDLGNIVSPVSTTGGVAVTSLSGITQPITVVVRGRVANQGPPFVQGLASVAFTPGPAASYSFDPISTQAAGVPFTVTITAEDMYGNTATSYSGLGTRVFLTDSTGTIAPLQSDRFTDGVLDQSVTIDRYGTGIVITATSFLRSGTSGPFDVLPTAPDVTIAKTAVPLLVTYPGDELTYRVTVNNGGTYATDVTMSDLIPENTSYVSGSASATTGTVTYIPPQDTIAWSGDIAGDGGSAVITFKALVDSPLASGTRITNTASVSESHLSELGEARKVNIVRSRLDMQKTAVPAGGSAVNPGDSIDYTVVLTNVSGGDLSAVVVTDTLDPNTIFVAATEGVSHSAGQLTWTGMVTAHETVALTCTVQVDPGLAVRQAITNTVEVDDGQGNSFTDEVTHDVASALAATKIHTTQWGDNLVYPGELVTYTLLLNTSDGSVSWVQVTDPIPAYTTFVPGSEFGGAVYQSGEIQWAGSVSGLTVIGFAVRVDDSIPAGTDIVNVATIDDGISPPWTEEDSGVTTESPLGISKTAAPVAGSDVQAGNQLLYQLRLDNNDPGRVLTFSLVDDLDDNVLFDELVSWTGSPTPTVPAAGTGGGQITWSREITYGQFARVRFLVTTTSVIADGTVITNLLTVDDGAGSSLTELVTHTVRSSAGYDVNKTVSDPEPDVNDEVGYTIVVENTGGDVGTFLFLDPIPAETSYVAGSVSDNAEFDPGGANGFITATQTLNPGESITFTFSVTMEAGTPDGTLILNIATVSLPDAPGQPIASDFAVAIARTHADLSTSTKEGTPDQVAPGDFITYSITLTNTGSGEGAPDDVHLLSDAIPDGTSWAGWIYQPDGAVYNPSGSSVAGLQALGIPLWMLQADGGLVYWPGKVSITQPVTLSFRVKVDSDAVLGQEITNIAVVNYEGQEDSMTDVAQVVGTSEISIDKSVDEPNPSLTEQVQYTILMTNTGDFTLDVSVADDVGNGMLEVVTTTITPPSAVYTNGQIVWDGPVNSGQEIVIIYEAVVPDTLQPGDMVTNTVTAAYLDRIASDTARVTVAEDVSAAKYVRVGLQWVKARDAYPTGGLTYALMVTNTGVADAMVSLADQIPDGLGDVTPLPGLSGMLGYTDYPVPTVYTDTTVAAGTRAVFRYTVTVDEGQPVGEIINQFSYQVADGDLMISDPVTVTVESPLNTSLKIVDTDTANVDDILEYTIALINAAPAQDVSASVADTIPEYTSFVAGSEGVSHTGGQVTWSGTVTAVDAVVITFTVQVTSKVPQYPTDIINTATVDDGLGNPQIDLGPVTTTVESKIVANKQVDAPTAYPGSVLEYTITLNAGDSSSMELSDPIPENTTYVEGSATGGGYDPVNDRIYLLTGVSLAQVTFQVVVDNPLATPVDIVNTAYITDDTNTMFSVDATTEITTPLVVSKAGLDPAVAGEEMEWQISIHNRSDAATTFFVTDTLPTGLEWISTTLVVTSTGSFGYVDATRMLTWTGTVDGIGNGLADAVAVETLNFPVTVTLGLANGTPITNEIQIDDGAGTILSASGVVIVSSAVDLSASSKAASAPDPVPGDTVVYTITVANDGNMDAAGITVTDTVPANMTYVEGSASDGGSLNGTTLTWDALPTLDAGDSMVLTFEAMVDDGVLAGTRITNTAWISQSTLTSAVSPSVVIAVGELRMLDVSKSVVPAVPIAGEMLTYTIQVVNTGNIAVEVDVTDPIPDNTTYVPGSVSPPATYVGAVDQIQLRDETLGPAETLTVTFAVQVETATTITNTAQVQADGLTYEATAVAVPAGPLASIIVSPTAVTLASGEVVTFTAVGYDAAGIVVPDFDPTWSVADPNAGTIDPATGAFTAGTIGGIYPDVVVATADSINGYADVTVLWDNELFLPLVFKNAP